MKRGLNSNQIKLIAITAMTIDHLTWVFFPGFQTLWYVIALHVIGRLTAPIMWFFVAEGYHYTHNAKKYLKRLFFFAIISHFAYTFGFGIPFIPFTGGSFFNQTSVMWSLAWAVALLMIYDSGSIAQWLKLALTFAICVIAFPSDWSSIAVMAPVFLYKNRGNFRAQARTIVLWTAIYAAVYFFFIDRVYGVLQLCTALSIPVLACYNGERGTWKGMKWLFYVYYPAHLVVIGVLRLLICGNVPILF